MNGYQISRLAVLCDMLTYCRPHGSITEAQFIAKFIAPLPGAFEDTSGNYHVKIGESPILWSSHTDTVHKDHGYQTIRHNRADNTIQLSRRSKARGVRCLGADDTVGCFLMREMILRGVSGHYIFHNAEECGGVGSSKLRDHEPHLIQSALFAIALDRMGTEDVITSQMFGECASSSFAESLAAMLPGRYKASSGTFTDTANYADCIPECSNISVGYYRQHTPDEWIDLDHVFRLLEALCVLDSSRLVCVRDPYAPPPPRAARVLSFDKYDLPFWNTASSASTPRATLDDSDLYYAYCEECDAPIISPDSDDPDEIHLYAIGDCCKCAEELDLLGLSEDDRRFMAYLRGLDR